VGAAPTAAANRAQSGIAPGSGGVLDCEAATSGWPGASDVISRRAVRAAVHRIKLQPVGGPCRSGVWRRTRHAAGFLGSAAVTTKTHRCRAVWPRQS